MATQAQYSPAFASMEPHRRYWEIDESSPINVKQKQAYRIELVGVTCDTGLAVARGIWRKIRTGRSVPVHSQLRSHRLFAENFEDFAAVVDSATLYHTGAPSPSLLPSHPTAPASWSPPLLYHTDTSLSLPPPTTTTPAFWTSPLCTKQVLPFPPPFPITPHPWPRDRCYCLCRALPELIRMCLHKIVTHSLTTAAQLDRSGDLFSVLVWKGGG